MNKNNKFLFILSYFLFISQLLYSKKKLINWNNVFLKKVEETKYYDFGILEYKLNSAHTRPFTYQKIYDNTTNKICGFLKYDNTVSFSMKYRDKAFIDSVRFDKKQKNKYKYL